MVLRCTVEKALRTSAVLSPQAFKFKMSCFEGLAPQHVCREPPKRQVRVWVFG